MYAMLDMMKGSKTCRSLTIRSQSKLGEEISIPIEDNERNELMAGPTLETPEEIPFLSKTESEKECIPLKEIRKSDSLSAGKWKMMN